MNMTIQGALWPGWETVRLIGRGDFGAVYEIQRQSFSNTEIAALKVISIPQNDNQIDEMRCDGYDDENIAAVFRSQLERVVNQYDTLGKLRGTRNIVSCDDIRFERHIDKIGWNVYIKMELLTPLIKSLPSPVPEETVIKMGIGICAALEQCQKYQVVHRNIKPQNIFLTENGEYKLGDFGLSKIMEETMSGPKTSAYKYMAPEVYHNQPYGAGADIYSLGLVMYWMLNDRHLPFVPMGKTMMQAEKEARHRRFSGHQIPAPRHGSAELRQIVLKACAFDPKNRFHSAQEMLDVLENLQRRRPSGRMESTLHFHGVISTEERDDPTEFDDDKTMGLFFPFARK